MSIINAREMDDQLFAKIGGKACAEPLMKRACELPGSHWVQSIAEHDATDYLVNLEFPERISRDSSSFQQLYDITADLANSVPPCSCGASQDSQEPAECQKQMLDKRSELKDLKKHHRAQGQQASNSIGKKP